MSSLGPLGPPPTAPIINPIMWAPELPVNRPQMHTESATSVTSGIRAHMVGAGPPRHEEGASLERHVVTPIDIEERAALAHEMTFHRTAEASGAWLDPSDPKAPFGATVKNPEGEPVAERMGPVDDPYSIAIAGGEVTTTTGVTTAMDEDSILGDGSLVGAEAAIEAICHAVDVSVAKV
ncbi:hypothetical protein Vafri_17857 [Volvox africanus]|uniref:Uncharacterized protein n=1 Tax=Volvox africanus TaxID=51714 RepID=A0A8J4BRE1_9CHLO|nr:hypothetical protein Vafri_17857 [Volvox africanus]